MKKYIFDESNGLWYELQVDYYIPYFTLLEVEIKEIEVRGMLLPQRIKILKAILRDVYNK